MAQQKTTSLKVFLVDEQDRQIEVRRFGVDQDVTFTHLCNKLKIIFSILQRLPFQISWKDADGDDIIVSSDEELQEAVSGDSECYKLRIKLIPAASAKKNDVPESSSLFLPSADESGEPVLHRGICCDGCENEIKGTRYKCLQCEDFDLCRACENTGMHSDHAMLRLCKPIAPTKAYRFHKFCHMSRRLFENNLKDGSESYSKHMSQCKEQMQNFLKLKDTLEGFFSPLDFDLLLCGDDDSEPTVLMSSGNKASSKCEQSVGSQTESATSESSLDLSQDQAASNTAAKPVVPVKEENHASANNVENPKPAEVQSNFVAQPDTASSSAAGNNGPATQNLYPNLGFSYPAGPTPANNTPLLQRQFAPMYYPAAPVQNLGYPGYRQRSSAAEMYIPAYTPASTRNMPVVNSPFLYSTSSGTSANATYSTFPRPAQAMRPSTAGATFVHSSASTGPTNPIGPNLGSTVPFVQFSNPVVNPPVPANLPEPLVPTPATSARLPTAPAATARTFVPPPPAAMTAEQRKEMQLWNAVEKLTEMGFSNHDGHVYHVAQLVDGNIDRAIERLIHK